MNKKLIIVAPALGSQTKKWEPLLRRFKDSPEFVDATWFVYNHKISWYSFRRAEAEATLLQAKINEMDTDGGFDQIVLIGHSLGGVLLRSAYLQAADDAYRSPGTAPWALKVTRLILFASLNRGFYFDKAPYSFYLIKHPAIFLIKLMATVGIAIPADILRGSNFITNLKIGWMRYFDSLDDDKQPQVVQFLGTKDGLVDKSDSIDVEQFPSSHQVLVPDANHANVIRIDHLPIAEQEARYKFFETSIFHILPTYQQKHKEDVNRYIFILPGIRDANSSWPANLTALINSKLPPEEREKTKVIIGNYGYFSARKFFLPWTRKNNIRWFQDIYSNCVASNPQADFNFIGHSNGTYILGRSLEKIPRMKFSKIYLASSVLPERYPWLARNANHQVLKLRSDMASRDWPVGILCRIMDTLGMRDVGSAGFYGFFNPGPDYQELSYYQGGHGKPVEVDNHASIVNYILGLPIAEGESTQALTKEISLGFRLFLSSAKWIAVVLGLLLLVWIISCVYLFFYADPHFLRVLLSGVIVLFLIYLALDII